MNQFRMVPGQSYAFADLPIEGAFAKAFAAMVTNEGWEIGGNPIHSKLPPVKPGCVRLHDIKWVGIEPNRKR
ncbi:hypothetical protein NO263_03850 [Gluconacetobacter entanii]|uniref:DUF1737 domain-containing protein n=1 Tax=Gluconacetobacter entanii TaxID=108528 RepID=A0ABT3K2R8_9PROT|nr:MULTISPECIES: hypothetical protein [Acetobacteraceae]MCW4589710.1 hypothetical protein [Gluconacetobacter entanii]MCW4593413.1 hypothetical protein [Gluconacetobacter entanii]NPC89216.1 hypothetical protein [Gluconacetobacter entanii]GBQ62941.1 hypothetical protein AA0243_2997 [Novacetimonas hansenii NRIC 0243]